MASRPPEGTPPKPRRFTLPKVWTFLDRDPNRVWTPDEIGAHFGCSVATVNTELTRWCREVAGIVYVKRGPQEVRGWKIARVTPDSAWYEPTRPLLRDCLAKIEALEREVAMLRRERGEREALGVRPDGSVPVPPGV